MALPKIDVPVFELKLPSNGKRVRYRPFLVKEEKLLLLAVEGGDAKEGAAAIKQVLNNCTIEPKNLDIDSLPTFDIEYFFLQLRGKSVAETVDMTYSCQIKDEKTNQLCPGKFPIEIDISKVEVLRDPKHTNEIEIAPHIGVVMKYPKLDTTLENVFEDEEENAHEVDILINIIAECMESIYDEENVHQVKDTPKQEVLDFILGLTQNQFEKLREFFETAPKLYQKIEAECPTCKQENTIELEGLQSFFG